MKRSAAPTQTGKRARGWKAPRKTVARVYNPRPSGSVYRPRPSGTLVGARIGFPPTIKFKHKYRAHVTTSGSGLQSYQFRCNGMYDPDSTGVGSQPLYFDQLAAVYNHYTVISSHIKVTSIPAPNTTEDAYRIILFLNDGNAITPATSEAIAEQTSAVSTVCSSLNPSTSVLERSWSLARAFGGRVSESRFTGNAGADPSEQTIYNIVVQAMDGGVSSVAVYHDVEIEYTAVWSELKDIPGS